MGKPVDYNLYPGYQNTQDSRLDERKEEYIEVLEKAKIDGYILEFEKSLRDELSNEELEILTELIDRLMKKIAD